MRSRHASEPVEGGPFWRQRRWQVSAAFVVLALCAGVGAAVYGGGDDVIRAAPATGPVIGGLGPDGSRPQGCRTVDTAQQIPVAAPDDVTWRPVNGAQTPFSASAGPLRTTGPLRWCFAHTPMGAVLAVHTISRQMSGPDWRTVSRQQLVPGLGRDYFDAMRESLEEGGPPQTTNRLAGFLVVRYTPRTAVVRVLVRQATARYFSVDYTADWNDVDWRLRPLTSGGLYGPVTAVVSLTGFVLWRGVGDG